MQLIRFSPFGQELDKFWENNWSLVPQFTESSAMDMYEEGGKLVAEVRLPNFKKNEVKVTADGGELEVSAEHQEEEEKKSKRRYYFRETSDQYFRRITLPEGARGDKATASFDNGLLKVSLPLTTSKKSKAITVK